MRVYLDSAHIAMLERTPEHKIRAFLSDWDSCGAALVLSFHHIQEIAQLESLDAVKRRLDLLDRFTNLQSILMSASQVLQAEAAEQLLEILGYPSRGPLLQSSFVDYNLAQTAAPALLSEGSRSIRATHSYAIEIENIVKHFTPRPTDLPRDLDGYSAALNNAEARRPREMSSSNSDLDFIRHLGPEVRHRDVLISVFGLRKHRCLQQIPTVDFPLMSFFFSLVGHEAAKLARETNVNSDTMDEAVQGLNPYICPGFSIQAAVARARRLHPKASVVSDMIDEQHVIFAPYVDLIVVDKRTLGFVRQERAHHAQLLPRYDATNMVRAGDLTALTAVLTEHA
jgi:hypothetical protein